MSETSTKDKAPVEVFREMERRDEAQILKELQGELISDFVYSIQIRGRAVTNLSYAGVKEAIRRRGDIEILDIKTESDDKEYRALIIVRDHQNKIDVTGASSTDRSQPFAYVLSVNKAERNAFAKLLPAKWIASVIHQYLQQGHPGEIEETSRESNVQKSTELDRTNDQPENPPIGEASIAIGWKVPLTKDQAAPEQIKAGVRQYPLYRGLRSYGMINQLEDEISIVPEKAVDPNSPPIKWFIHGNSIKQGVVIPICEKYGLKWQLELNENGSLKAVMLYGERLNRRQIDELSQGATWAFRVGTEPLKQEKPDRSHVGSPLR
jgi:hypothetical protein